MTIQELIDDLMGYDKNLQVVFCTGMNSNRDVAQFADYTYLDGGDDNLHKFMPIKSDQSHYQKLTDGGFVVVIQGCEGSTNGK